MARLYPFEERPSAGGYPALAYCRPGSAGQPLVVFVTGGGVLARVSYGHPEGNERDFLAFWLREAGYPFLALSYPLGHGLFESVHPGFSVQDWGEQVADVAARIVEEQGLARDVVVLAWSMAGRIAAPLADALRRRGCGIALFIAMAAATPALGQLPALERLTKDGRGLADVSGAFTGWLARCLAGQGETVGREIIPEALFRREFVGNFPVNLAACSLRWRNGDFVPDVAADLADTQAFHYADFPPLALMTHDGVIDFSHALMDAGAWGFYITQAMCARLVFPQADRLGAVRPEDWHRVVQRLRAAPRELTMIMPGNHMFFMGEAGARATVAGLDPLLRAASEIPEALSLP